MHDEMVWPHEKIDENRMKERVCERVKKKKSGSTA